MKIIAAYPCLGKTTIYNLNKDRCFDREFNESRSTLGMTKAQTEEFFEHCAEIIKLQFYADYHDIMFITADDRLLYKLIGKIPKLQENLTLVFPDISNKEVLLDYKCRVIARSGEAWYKRVIEPEIDTLWERINRYVGYNYDVRLTNLSHPYIENVVTLPDNFVLPNKHRDDTFEKSVLQTRGIKMSRLDLIETIKSLNNEDLEWLKMQIIDLQEHRNTAKLNEDFGKIDNTDDSELQL